MTGITEMLKQGQDERQRRMFEHMMEAFSRNYRPNDPREGAQFDADLHSIVRQIYADAQQPILDRFTQLAMSVPMPLKVTQSG